MKNQQVGDALVFSEGQAQRRFGLGAGLGVTVDVAVDSIDVTVYTVHSVWDGATYKKHQLVRFSRDFTETSEERERKQKHREV